MKWLFCVLIFIFFQSCQTCDENVREIYGESAYEGTITGKYEDKKDRGQPYIIIDSVNHYFCNYTIYDKLDVSDYIIKRKGSVRYTIVRNRDTTDLYPICDDWLLVKDDTVMSLR